VVYQWVAWGGFHGAKRAGISPILCVASSQFGWIFPGVVYRVDEVANETAIAGKNMTGSQTSYITVTYGDCWGFEMMSIYAANEGISRELDRKRDWLGRKLTGTKLQAWLEKKGCREIPWVNF
jgi:hypothetical protein